MRISATYAGVTGANMVNGERYQMRLSARANYMQVEFINPQPPPLFFKWDVFCNFFRYFDNIRREGVERRRLNNLSAFRSRPVFAQDDTRDLINTLHQASQSVVRARSSMEEFRAMLAFMPSRMEPPFTGDIQLASDGRSGYQLGTTIRVPDGTSAIDLHSYLHRRFARAVADHLEAMLNTRPELLEVDLVVDSDERQTVARATLTLPPGLLV